MLGKCLNKSEHKTGFLKVALASYQVVKDDSVLNSMAAVPKYLLEWRIKPFICAICQEANFMEVIDMNQESSRNAKYLFTRK